MCIHLYKIRTRERYGPLHSEHDVQLTQIFRKGATYRQKRADGLREWSRMAPQERAIVIHQARCCPVPDDEQEASTLHDKPAEEDDALSLRCRCPIVVRYFSLPIVHTPAG